MLATTLVAASVATTLLQGISRTALVSIDLQSGVVQKQQPRNPLITAPACALSNSTFFTLIQNASQGLLLHAVRGKTSQQFPLPFDVKSAANVGMGLDLHMASDGEGNVLITGPDQLGFVHMLNVSAPGHYEDVIQYSEGTRLARGISAFDHARGELWLQVAYDTSGYQPGQGQASNDTYATYLKRYDMATKTLLDVVADPQGLAVLAFDDSASVSAAHGIGWCATRPRTRCLFRLNSLTNGKSANTPVLEEVAPLPPAHQLIMAGVAKVAAGVLYVVMAPSNDAQGPHHATYKAVPSPSPLHCKRPAGGEGPAICTRDGDGLAADAAAARRVVGVELATGTVRHPPVALDWQGAPAELVLCGL